MDHILLRDKNCIFYLSTTGMILRPISNVYVADIRGGNKTNSSSVRLDHLLTPEAPASPTHPA